MRQLKALFLGSALIGASMVSGCASTAKGVKQSVLRGGPEIGLRQEAAPGTVMAVVRYPAFVNASAEAEFAKQFAARAIGGTAKVDDPLETQALADATVLKSNYFAMSLYRELGSRLPEHGVLLSPHEIKLGPDGQLTSEPMTQAESLPHLVAVDFTAYTFPDSEKMMGGKPLTFGDLVTPVVTVRTDPRASVATEGLLLASAPVTRAAAGQAYAQAVADAAALEQGRIDAGVPELDIISYISGQTERSPSTVQLGRASDAAVRLYPVEKIKLDGGAVQRLPNDQNDVLELPFTNGFANQIIDLINRTDVEKAAMFRRADAVSNFDESLAALTLVGSRDADYLARLRYAERLLEAEQKYLSVQSLRLYDGVHNGEMGAQVRDMIKEETALLNRRRKLAKQQNIATAASVLAVVGAVAVASNSSGGTQDCRRARTQQEFNACRRGNNSARGTQAATNAMISGAIFSVQEAMRKNRLSKGVAKNYMQAVLPALSAQTEVQVDLIDSNETITAIRFEDLQDKLAELYAQNQRSLDTVATRCAYTGAGVQGTWLGACENGVANGSGVGVFRNASGELVEHYGYAVNGAADGPGYRIIRTASGSTSMEGNFSGGEANGPIVMSRSGSVQTRNFRQGRDVGGLPSSTSVASPFRLGA